MFNVQGSMLKCPMPNAALLEGASGLFHPHCASLVLEAHEVRDAMN
jgi:hypothetical protein